MIDFKRYSMPKEPDFMNEPIPYKWTDQDIIDEYLSYRDKRKVGRIYGITTKEVNLILKRNGVI